MRTSVRLRTAVVAALAAATLPAAAAAPTRPPALTAVIVQGDSAGVVHAVVQGVIDANLGVGKVVADLPLVNGVSASLTSTELGLLGSLVVTPDAPVLTAMDAKGSPAPPPAPTNVFRDVTGATTVASAGNTGQGVGVAVVDTGVANLSDFSGRLKPGVDLSGEGNAWLDSFGHGTFVAGLVAGNGASSSGKYVGEAPGADIVPVKVAGKSGATTVSVLIRGLQWLYDNPGNVRVVNLSVGAVPRGPSALNPLNQAVEAMWRANFVVVASAGNNGSTRGTITSPGDDPLVVTVGALDDKHTTAPGDDTVASFSSNGPTASDGTWKPDLLASGKSVVSVTSTTSVVWNANKAARIGTRNFVGSGTSFSAAVASGAAALLVVDNPTASPDAIKAALLTTTNAGPGPPNDPTAHDPFSQGHGVLDVARAVDEPSISLVQDLVRPVPVLGSVLSLALTQLTSTWPQVTVDLLGNPVLPLDYPFPYSGAATTSPYFTSTAWNSTAWNSTAWNSTAWNSTAWNSTAWNSTAWNSTAWNSTAWN
jgi:serine protease AprX